MARIILPASANLSTSQVLQDTIKSHWVKISQLTIKTTAEEDKEIASSATLWARSELLTWLDYKVFMLLTMVHRYDF